MSQQRTGTRFDDEEVRLLLLGTEGGVYAGLEQIRKRLRDRLCGAVRGYFPGLSANDLADLWGQTMVEFYTKVRSGDFDPNRPLLPLLLKIIFCRACDTLRRRTTTERALAAIGEALRSTSTGRWWGAVEQSDRKEIESLIRRKIAALPEKQRVVMQVFVDGFPDTTRMEYLRAEVSGKTGEVETLAAVKRALQEGRRKVRESLERKGLAPTHKVADDRDE